MAGVDNLRTPTTEEARERGSKGGIASGKARRKRKAMKETLDALLTMKLKNEKAADLDEIQSVAAMKGKNITVQEAIVFAQVQRALKGDTRAMMVLLEMLGDDNVGSTGQTEAHNSLIEAIRMRNNED